MSHDSDVNDIRNNTNSICTFLLILMFMVGGACCAMENLNKNITGLREDLKAQHPTTAP
jgi:hypothetical protein